MNIVIVLFIIVCVFCKLCVTLRFILRNFAVK